MQSKPCLTLGWPRPQVRQRLGAIPGKALFLDLFSLSEGPTAHDELSDTDKAVPNVHIFVAAFECDSYSSANPNRATGPGSLSEGRGSGKSGRACIQFLTARRPPIFVAENVRGITVKSTTTGTHRGIGRHDGLACWRAMQHFEPHPPTRQPTHPLTESVRRSLLEAPRTRAPTSEINFGTVAAGGGIVMERGAARPRLHAYHDRRASTAQACPT